MIATFDGACEPYNPGGAMGLGWTIDGVPAHHFVEAAPTNTNNVAEYMALERVLDAALAMSLPDTLVIYGDSMLVVEQLAGNWAVASPSIRPIYERCRCKMKRLHKAGWRVTLYWHRRENNEAADAASKAALVEHGIEPARRMPKSGYGNLTAVGRRVGISAVAAGRRLVATGWRGTDGEPTEVAIAAGIADRRFDGWGWRTDWRLDTLVAKTAEAELVTIQRRRAEPATGQFGTLSRTEGIHDQTALTLRSNRSRAAITQIGCVRNQRSSSGGCKGTAPSQSNKDVAVE